MATNTANAFENTGETLAALAAVPSPASPYLAIAGAGISALGLIIKRHSDGNTISDDEKQLLLNVQAALTVAETRRQAANAAAEKLIAEPK